MRVHLIIVRDPGGSNNEENGLVYFVDVWCGACIFCQSSSKLEEPTEKQEGVIKSKTRKERRYTDMTYYSSNPTLYFHELKVFKRNQGGRNMKKIVNLSIILFVAVAFLTGCATIVSKSEYPVTISSQPEGAEISIKNRAGETVFTGKTPTTVTLKAGAGYFKGENYTVTFKKNGYTPHTAQIERGLDGWYIAGNLVFGGLIGWLIVDPATGAMWTLKNLHVVLSPSQTSSIENTIQIVTIDEVPDHLRSQMVRVN